MASILNTGSQGSTEIQPLQFLGAKNETNSMVVSGAQDVQEQRDQMQATLTAPVAVHPGTDEESGSQVNSSDIRKIKLNYIQLNKRATTANNNSNGRKIPQKNVTGQEYSNQGKLVPNGGFMPQSQLKQGPAGQGTFNVYQDKANADMRNTMT